MKNNKDKLEVIDILENEKTDTKEVPIIEALENSHEEVMNYYEKKDKKKDKKKNPKKKKIIIIILCLLIIFLLIGGTLLVINLNKDNKKESIATEKEDKLTKKEQQNLVNNYGEALEGVIANYYQKNTKLPTFEEIEKLVDMDIEVKCSENIINSDGTVYLNTCKVDDIDTKYSYGKKEEVKVPVATVNEKEFNVYVNKTNKEDTTVTTPNNQENYDIYKITCDEKCFSPWVINSNYVVYYDEWYNSYIKNITTNTKILNYLNYQSVLPLKINEDYTTSKVAISINDKWGIYDTYNNKNLIPCIYDQIDPSLTLGITGPKSYFELVEDHILPVYKDNYFGVLDINNNQEIIPVKYKHMLKSGSYLQVGDSYSSGNKKIFDYYGNEYLTEYNEKYGIVNGVYVLLKDNNTIKMMKLDKTVLYEYKENNNISSLNYALSYNNGALFQFYKNDSDYMCYEYIYDPINKGTVKEEECGGIAKPILYLYPKKTTKVTVSFEHPEYLETTYPKFTDKWTVTAKKNGDLTDEKGKYYYALYWDEKRVHTTDFTTGFYVEKDNAIDFLEKKLDIIGLNKKEKNEFIMYWLPILEKNKNSLVYFELTEERESYNKINISPKPDSLLRVVIHIKKVSEKQNIKEEELTKFKRSGFTAVEWGGITY